MALITLTSDFGLQEYIAGALKGQLMQLDPSFQVHYKCNLAFPGKYLPCHPGEPV